MVDDLSFRNYIKIMITAQQYNDLSVLYVAKRPLRTKNPEQLPRFLFDLDLIECSELIRDVCTVRVASALVVHPYYDKVEFAAYLPLSD